MQLNNTQFVLGFPAFQCVELKVALVLIHLKISVLLETTENHCDCT